MDESKPTGDPPAPPSGPLAPSEAIEEALPWVEAEATPLPAPVPPARATLPAGAMPPDAEPARPPASYYLTEPPGPYVASHVPEPFSEIPPRVAPPAPPPPPSDAPPPPAPPPTARKPHALTNPILICAFSGLIAIIGVNVWIIEVAGTDTPAGTGAAPASEDGGAAVAPPAPASAPAEDASLPAAEAPAADAGKEATDAGEAAPEVTADAGPGSDLSDDDAPPTKSDKPPPSSKKPQTVADAASAGCSTVSVDALSRQIIAEARCVSRDAFAPIPRRKNLVTGPQVFPFLEAPARDHLIRVLDAHPNLTLTVNSAVRTIAQQYLLSKWGATKRCGVELAAAPSESNHETGLALDVREPGTWRPLLEAQGFRWLGPSDKVHFDYRGPGSVDHGGLDVLAFQRLWNRNHPDDTVPANGHYSSETEARLKKSPPGGFPKGPHCGPDEGRAAKAAHGPQ